MASNSDVILTPLEAAHHLGITPELLFAYVRYAPKSTGSDVGRRLLATTKDGTTLFRLDDLLSFDGYLKEPWSQPGDDRPDVPAYIGWHLKVESGGACARCGRGFNVETAHIEDYAKGRSHHHHNLIRLCSLCHGEFDSKRILAAGEIASLKKMLIDATRARLSQRINGPTIKLQPPPLRTSFFFGRDELLERVVSAVGSFPLLCLHGVGGIGKTQLALHALHHWNQSAITLWIDAEPFSASSDIAAALTSSIASAIGLATTADAVGLIEEHFDVIVFDGIEVLQANDFVKFQEFVARLASRTRTVRVVITSQLELLEVEDLQQIHVLPLDNRASFDLVSAVASEQATELDKYPEQAVSYNAVVDFADGHPLTLRLAAQLLRYFKSPSIVAQRISQFGARTLALPGRQKQTKGTSLHTCLSVAYAELSVEARRTLYVLSHCPAGCYAKHIPWRDLQINDRHLVLAELRQWDLVIFNECWRPVRLEVLSPIRSFCRTTLEDEDAVEASRLFEALATFAEVLAAVLDSSYTRAGDAGFSTASFEHEFPNFGHIFDEAVRLSSDEGSYDRLICSLAFSLQVFCFVSGRSHRGRNILDAAVLSASRMGWTGLAASLLLQVANFSDRAGDEAGAIAAYEKIIALRLVENDPELCGNVSYARAMLAIKSGDDIAAENHLLDAAALYAKKTSGSIDSGVSAEPVNQRMQALALMRRAMLYEHSGREREALSQYDKTLELMRAIDDRVNEGSVLHQMGNCHANVGAYSDAYACYAQAARLFFGLGSAIHLSNSLGELGFVLLDYRFDSPAGSAISSEIVQAGMDDLLRELVTRFDPASPTIELVDCDSLIRKLIGLLCLCSLSDHALLLVEFSSILEAALTRPLVERFRSDKTVPNGAGWLTSHLQVFTIFAESSTSHDKASVEEIAHYCDLCHLLGSHSWKMFRLFEWLSAYLQRRRGWPDVTASALQDAMDNVVWGDGSFSILE